MQPIGSAMDRIAQIGRPVLIATGTLLFAVVAAGAFAGWIKAGPSMLGALVLSGLIFCF